MIVEKNKLTTETLAKVVYGLNEEAYTASSSWSVEQIKAAIENKYTQFLLLKEQGEWVGYLSYQWVLDEAEITQAVVLPAYQRQGYGRQLMQAFLTQMQEQQINRVFLEVRVSNKRAQRLYEKSGFTMMSVRKKYYHQPTEDGYVMCLTIGEVSK